MSTTPLQHSPSLEGKDKLFHLKVVIGRGKSIVGSDATVCSPYLKVSWGNKKKATKTKVVNKSADPEWNHPIQFEIKRIKFADKKPDIEIEVYEHNKFSGDKMIGECSYTVSDNVLILGEITSVQLPVTLNVGTKYETKAEIGLQLTPLDFGQDKAVVEKQRQEQEQKKQMEVEKQFESLADQLANDAKAKEVLLKLPYKSKLQLIEQHKDKLNRKEKSPDEFAVKLIKELALIKAKKVNVSVSGSTSPGAPGVEGLTMSDLKDISVALRSRGLDWIKQFHKLEATTRLVEYLGVLSTNNNTSSTEESILKQLECLLCIKSIMNNKVGLGYITRIKDSIKTIGLSIGSSSEKINELAIGLLNTICFVSEDLNGHKEIIEIMNTNKIMKKENRRFVSLVEALKSKGTKKESKDALRTKATYLSFINTIVNRPAEIDLRLSLRQEFQWLGLKDILVDLSKYEYDDSPELDTQITVYQDEETKDNKEMAERFAEFSTLDLNNTDEVLKVLMERIKPNGLIDTFKEVVKDLLLVPITDDVGVRTWLIASRIIKQISLRDKNIGVDEDIIVPLDNLLLTCEQEAKELPLKAKIEELNRAQAEFTKKINSHDIEIKEKVESMKRYEEVTIKQIEELKGKIGSKDTEIKQLTDQLEQMKTSGARIPDVIVNAGVSAPPAPPGPPPPGPPPPPPPPGGGPPPPPPPPGGGPPPPPPPPGGGPPPPPPPPGGGPPGPPPPPGMPGPPPPPGMGFGKKPAAPPRKVIPVPSMKMKGLQWTSLNDKKITGTVFSKFTIDTSKDINLDYKDMEDVFAAKVIEKKDTNAAPKKAGPVQIIDPKTSQNLSIFLSQFKGKSFDDICGAILAGDEGMFQSNHIDALITFLPSDDDINNINEYLKENPDVTKMGPAEQFSLKINAVPQVKQRLIAMKFKFSYDPKKTDIKVDIDNFSKGTKQLQDSEKMVKIIEVILIMGNFINGGTARGNAYGFKLNTITKLADTKSTDNKSSLINYLSKTIQKDFPHLLTFAKDLTNVEAASRISFPNLLGEIATLKKEFTQVQSTIEAMVPQNENDHFKTKYESFVQMAAQDIEQITARATEIEAAFKALATYFGEDPKIDPSEFFAIFVKFIDQFDKSTKENEQLTAQAEKIAKREAAKKLKEEEDAKKKLAAEERKKKGGEEAAMPESVVDDLLNTIASGDAFKNRRRAGRGAAKAAPKDLDLDSVSIEI